MTVEKVILQTNRLKISIPTIGSLDNWCKLQSDKDVMKYIGDGKIRNTATTKENLEFTINHYKKHSFSQFDIFLKEDNKFIGKAGLNYLPQDKNNDIEVGYLLHKKYWGKGYATELAETFIKWGFDKFHFSRIVACCEEENTASSNVMKKCKMKYRGKYLYNGKNECDIYHINNIVIKTDNFYLKPFHEIDDFDLSYDLWNDTDVLKSMECNPCTKKDIEEKLERYKLWMDKFGFTNFAVFNKESDEFVGSCGMSLFHNPDNDRNPLEPINGEKYLNRDIELGYVLHKKYWGKGYASELAKACVNFVFDNNSDIERIVAVTVPNNIASQKVLTKTGFKFVSNVDSKEYGKESFFVIKRKKEIEIDNKLVESLVQKQLPQYSNLPITSVKQQGHDNRTFHLGNDMLIRMPSGQDYASKVEIEQKYLPKLAPHISLKIPRPIHMGKSSKDYPFNWSIYEWIEGDSLNQISKNKLNLAEVAKDLASFIKELHKIDTKDAPMAGKHNFYRGVGIDVYFDDAISYIKKLEDIIDSKKAVSVMEEAINSKWEREPVWIHGDLATPNILIKDNKVNAIIDFGGMAIGDPACDLVLYWNFFEGKSQSIFKSELNLDKDTWDRAKGWALWKACFELVQMEGEKSEGAVMWLDVIENIIDSSK